MELYLINEVCKREALWNDKHEHYKDPKKQYYAWIEIAEILDLRVEEAFVKWRDLEACFRKEHEMVLGGTLDWKKSPFNYYSMMLFLTDAKGFLQRSAPIEKKVPNERIKLELVQC